MSERRERLAGLDDHIHAEMARWHVPGLAVAVIDNGEVIHQQGYGVRDVETGQPVTADTLFAIGSSSKAFTAMTVALLVDDGALDWDRPIRHDLPRFRLYDPVASEQMTARDLLCHRSGLPRHDLMWYGSPHTRQELFDRLQYLKPTQPFRYLFQYQNLMYMTAGCLVEAVSGQTWEAFARARIFEPLGMTRSVFSVVDAEQIEDAARPHKYDKASGTIKRIPFRNIDAIGPAGNIHSSLTEMIPWLLMHMQGGQHNGQAFVKADTLKQMHQPQVTIPALPPLDFPEILYRSYGLGWTHQNYRGHPWVWHGGSIDGFISDVSFMPQDGLAVIVFNNGGDGLSAALALHIYDRLLGLDTPDWRARRQAAEDALMAKAHEAVAKFREARRPDAPPCHPLADYTGEYEHPGYGLLTVTLDGDALSAAYNGLGWALAHHHYDVFEGQSTYDTEQPPAPLSFGTGLDGAVASVSIPLEPTGEPITFTRKAD